MYLSGTSPISTMLIAQLKSDFLKAKIGYYSRLNKRTLQKVHSPSSTQLRTPNRRACVAWVQRLREHHLGLLGNLRRLDVSNIAVSAMGALSIDGGELVVRLLDLLVQDQVEDHANLG